jgi:hypothetical protein
VSVDAKEKSHLVLQIPSCSGHARRLSCACAEIELIPDVINPC